jgi:hypothetical protein
MGTPLFSSTSEDSRAATSASPVQQPRQFQSPLPPPPRMSRPETLEEKVYRKVRVLLLFCCACTCPFPWNLPSKNSLYINIHLNPFLLLSSTAVYLAALGSDWLSMHCLCADTRYSGVSTERRGEVTANDEIPGGISIFNLGRICGICWN